MGVLDMVDADFMHLVQDVTQVRLRIHPHPLHGGHNAADDPLLTRSRRVGQAGLLVYIQAVQMGQQLVVYKVKQLAIALGK
jgi:hypothetical protein